jgi:hypothetical protein
MTGRAASKEVSAVVCMISFVQHTAWSLAKRASLGTTLHTHALPLFAGLCARQHTHLTRICDGIFELGVKGRQDVPARCPRHP